MCVQCRYVALGMAVYPCLYSPSVYTGGTKKARVHNLNSIAREWGLLMCRYKCVSYLYM